MAEAENVCPQAWGGAAGGLARELRRLAAAPPPGVKLQLSDDDLSQFTALIEGPAETPYEGGVFRVRLLLGGGYPARAPRAVFLTRVFHPNVSARGEVCVDTLAREWRPERGLAHALLALRCLLIAPNPDSALNAEAAALLRDRYADYAARARLYTEIHARPALSAAAAPSSATDTQQAVEAAAGEGEAAAGEGEAAAGRGPGEGEGEGEGEGPSAKRERRHAPAPAARSALSKDKRRILKRL